MTARAVKEWIGATPDTRPPPRVLLRIFQRENGVCHISGRKIATGERWQAEHKIALINGGRNSEDNLFPALIEPHKAKTRQDMKEKARVAKRAKSNIGARPRPIAKIPARQFPQKAPPKPPVSGLSNIARRFATREPEE